MVHGDGIHKFCMDMVVPKTMFISLEVVQWLGVVGPVKGESWCVAEDVTGWKERAACPRGIDCRSVLKRIDIEFYVTCAKSSMTCLTTQV